MTHAPVLPGLFSEPPPTVEVQRDPPIVTEKRRQGSNRERVLAYLKLHGSALNWELATMEIGGMRAMARVWELKKKGQPITVTQEAGGTWRITLTPPEVMRTPR